MFVLLADVEFKVVRHWRSELHKIRTDFVFENILHYQTGYAIGEHFRSFPVSDYVL